MKLTCGDKELIDLPEGTVVYQHTSHPVYDSATLRLLYVVHTVTLRAPADDPPPEPGDAS